MKNSNKPLLDKVIMEFEYALESIFNDRNITTEEKNTVSKSNLTKGDSDKSIKIMRVNHMGEVCAQALYRGQAIVTKDIKIKNKLYKMCNEESNHLQLCNLRLMYNDKIWIPGQSEPQQTNQDKPSHLDYIRIDTIILGTASFKL
jgi:hypothetical protein